MKIQTTNIINTTSGKISAVLLTALCLNTSSWALSGTYNNASSNDSWSNEDNWVNQIVAGGANFTATFDGSPGAARTVSLTEPVTISHIAITNWTSGQWRISGNTLTLASPTTGKPTITTTGTGDSIRIASLLAGSSGFEKLGSGRLHLNNANNSLTGGITISAGTLWTATAGTISNNTITLNGGDWLIDGSETHTYNNNIILSANTTILNINNTGHTRILGGIISQTDGPRTLRLAANSGDVQFVLQGDNSYTGNTVIGNANTSSVVVRAEHNNAFGTGSADVQFNIGSKTHDSDAVELANNITISNKSFILRGQGRDDAGSLRSVSGNNTWAGSVDTGTFGNATIGVDSDTLTISGTISGSGANGLTKIGNGTLILNNTNTYTNGTAVHQGILQAEHDHSLAGGNVSIASSATLSIATGVSLNVNTLTLEGTLAFSLNHLFDVTKINVAQDQLGTGTYIVEITNNGITEGTYTLMNITGNHQATNFILGAPNSNYSLDWSEGTLSLNVIPEPATPLFLLLSAVVPAFRRRLKKN